MAPIIHEWTYEAMVYDLLEVDENVYRQEGLLGCRFKLEKFRVPLNAPSFCFLGLLG